MTHSRLLALVLLLGGCHPEPPPAAAPVRSDLVAVPDWEKAIVPQRKKAGCVPTGFEILLRAVGGRGVELERFQEEFDCGGANDFETVADAIRDKYPFLRFGVVHFDSGIEKLQFLEQRVALRQMVLLSLPLKPRGPWHVMPVVMFNDTDLFLAWGVKPAGKIDLRRIAKTELIRRHEEWEGGKDIAYLDEE